MKYFLISFILLITFGCVEHFEIPAKDENLYDSYGNLGFEDGLNHWFGISGLHSRIVIETESYEGLNSLKLSLDVDSTFNESANDLNCPEVSKYLDVNQGDTVQIGFRMQFNTSSDDGKFCLFSFSKFYNADGVFIQENIDTVNAENQGWSMKIFNYPVPQNSVRMEFGVRLTGMGGSAFALLDDFSIAIINLKNQNPSNVDLLLPLNNSSLSSDDNIVLTWTEATDDGNAPVTYKVNLWTETVVENYLVNSDFESVVTHWLGDEIPADWDYWPYYYHNVFSYPQLGDSIFNSKYIRSGDFSMSITGDFTGQSNKTILYQGFDTNYIPPGTRVTFSGYMLNPSHDIIRNNNQAYLSIDQFFSGSVSLNNSTLLLNHTSESITKNYSTDDWHYFEVSSTTQENTNYLQMRINYEQFNDDSGTVFIDDLSITTSNNKLMLFEVENIDTSHISIDRGVFTGPYDFNYRSSMIYYWNVQSHDEFSSSPSSNGPFRINLFQ